MRDRRISWRKALILVVAVLVGMGAWGIYAGQEAQAGSSFLFISHFKCYKTTGTPLNEQVRLFDRFHGGPLSPSTGGELVTVKGSHHFCTQVRAKCFPGDSCESPFTVGSLNNGLNCYKITPSGPPVGVTIPVDDQFAEQNLTVGTAQFLCTPARISVD